MAVVRPRNTCCQCYTDYLANRRQQPLKQSFCRSLRRDTHWKCLLLSLLICGCLAAIAWCRLTTVTRVVTMYTVPYQQTHRASPCQDGYVYIPVAFVVMLYLVYLVECWHCHTRLQLQCKVDVNTVYERIQAMKDAMPIVWWKAVCYHYVRRTRQVTRYRNGDAFTTTQVYYERVNSHTASSCFNFTSCGMKDVSKHLLKLEAYPATKIKFTKGFSFSGYDAEQEFEEQRTQFFQTHERMDDYMETREGLDLMNINFKEYMIAFADPDNLPWYISQVVFWMSSLLMLSWPLRVLIEYKTAYVHFHVHKLFGSNYSSGSVGAGRMSRAVTLESSEMEASIRNNYTLVPSYSEALLMECPGGESSTEDPPQQRYGAVTPNGSVPLVHLGNSICVAPGSKSTYISNGCCANGNVASGTIYQNVQANGYIPLGGENLGAKRHSANFSSSDTVGSTQRGHRKRKRKHRRRSYNDAIQAPSDSEGNQQRRNINSTTSTPESPSDPDSLTLPSRDSSFEMIDSEGGTCSGTGAGITSTTESSIRGTDEVLVNLDDKSGAVLGETSNPSSSVPSKSETVSREQPPAYELALAMTRAGLSTPLQPSSPAVLGQPASLTQGTAERPTSLPPTRSWVPAYQQDSESVTINARPEPPIKLMETTL